MSGLFRNSLFDVSYKNGNVDNFNFDFLWGISDKKDEESIDGEMESGDENVPLQLAIVGRPNVGKSTLLNTLLQEERVLVGPEAGLTRDSIRTQFQFDNQTIYLVCYDCSL